jgi:hypothetical protein
MLFLEFVPLIANHKLKNPKFNIKGGTEGGSGNGIIK